MIRRIISGGQTGADRGGLDAAIELGIAHGGWCPKGRRAEDGEIPARYALTETAGRSYRERTDLNVRSSDGTVIFYRGRLEGGSRRTADTARKEGKPRLLVRIEHMGEAVESEFRAWVAEHRIEVLNVAGNRESRAPGIQQLVKRFLLRVLPPKAYEAAEKTRLPAEGEAAGLPLAAEAEGKYRRTPLRRRPQR